jgi:DNA-binding LytR/AlgR family response regulator
MVSLMAFCSDMKEYAMLRSSAKENAAKLDDDEWLLSFFKKLDTFKAKIEENPKLDIICYELDEGEGIDYAKYLRMCYEKAYMIVMASEDISPREYIRPDIMPAGLVLQPATKQDMDSVIRDVFESFINKRNREQELDTFMVQTTSGLIKIPYSDITHFESKDKKIYVKYDNMEVGFYSTMDKVEVEVEKRFVRVHRSFMVNKDYIRKIRLTTQEVVLRDNQIIPMSRRYKNVLREAYPQWRE